MKKLLRIALAALLPLATQVAVAAPCFVTSVSNGDTLTVRCGDRPAERVKLYGINAPGREQNFGIRARDALEALCGAQPVVLHRIGAFANRPTQAYVICDGLDANRKMLEMGLAKVNRQQTDDPDLIEIEATARETGSGLWSPNPDPNPTPKPKPAAKPTRQN